MPPVLQALARAVGTRWAALPDRTRWLILVGVGVAGLTGALLLVLVSRPTNLQLLFANLPPEDAAAVTDALRQARVPFKVAQNGSQILVPSRQVHEWRLKLASRGLPAGGGPGFELFDKAQFGTTDFTQRLNFQRALQGELAKTISQFREVVQARVHLAMPAPRLFTTQDKPASASVVVRLIPGAVLRPNQVRGVVHLVSGAVEGLPPDKVTVLDTSGRVLGSGTDQTIGGLSRGQLEAQAAVESEIERRVQTLLDHIVGVGRSAVRVAAQVNFNRVELTEERFDPNSVVRQESTSNEAGEGTSSRARGAPGTEAQTTPAEQANETNSRNQREAKQVSYEISRTVQKTVMAPGEVQRLSLAVLLDTPLVQGKRGARKPEELERIRRLVVSAAGIRADRGDQLEVVEIPFDPSVTPDTEPLLPQVEPAPVLPSWTLMALLLIVGIAVILILMRSQRQRQVLEAAAGASAALHAPGAFGVPEGEQPEEEAEDALEPLEIAQQKKDLLKERILDAIRQHPDETMQVLRAWMTSRRSPTR